MTWSRFDDRYDEHERIDDAWHAFPANPVGLHVMATTACNRWQSDGVIRPRWLLARLPERKERERLLAYAVEHTLFDMLTAGDVRDLIDSDGNEITIGPYEEDRYLVHDFLDRHDSSIQTKARRAADAERKRRGRRGESNESPNGRQSDGAADSAESPASRADAGASLPCPALPNPKDKEPPQPPASGGSVDQSGDVVELEDKRNPRAKGTAPRQVAAAQEAEARKSPAQREREMWARENFPDHPVAEVFLVAQQISRAGERLTIEAVRAYLERAA